ncbi:hypothetical protein [Staphylococcus capitis]|uniref:Uncharacterized protein n=1 Tax=Staphylococcus capitis TaxID=29388 RepID=A0ABX1SNW1_STACP|nr:hypothetical protein [Staphylococcus capitis]NMK53985.1 hypothetical protein [Staphylococcus capitis]NMK69322.1 hypothetical protein [Staphylococcus capitis]
MFDTLDNILRNILEPIGSTGRNVILVVAAALLVFTVIMSLVALSRQRFGQLLLWVAISIGIFLLGTKGYQITKSLGEKQGDDFEGQINAIFALGLLPTYAMHLKYKHQKKKSA